MKFLFGFFGRISRAKYAAFLTVALALNIGFTTVMFLLLMLGVAEGMGSASLPPNTPGLFEIFVVHADIVYAAVIIVQIVFFATLLATTTKRLHDRGKGAIWLLPYVGVPAGISALLVALRLATSFEWFTAPHPGYFAALIGGTLALAFWLGAVFELCFLQGTSGDNRFGPDPLG